MTRLDFADLEKAVERRVHLGEPLERVEDFIERQELPGDLKAALWLFAWSMEEEPAASHPGWGRADEIDEVHD